MDAWKHLIRLQYFKKGLLTSDIRFQKLLFITGEKTFVSGFLFECLSTGDCHLEALFYKSQFHLDRLIK